MLFRRAAWLLLLSLPGAAAARSLPLVPKTTHPPLTLSGDGSYGYQVAPKDNLRIDVVGPGKLTITLRLNSNQKLPSFQGTLELRQDKKIIKKTKLTLVRALGAQYKEDRSLYVSLPQVVRLNAPAGLHTYFLKLFAKRSVSVCVGFEYDSEVSQTAAQEPDDLALVRLVPDAPSPENEVPIVPLVPKKPVVVADRSPPPVDTEPPLIDPDPAAPAASAVSAVPAAPAASAVSAAPTAPPAPLAQLAPEGSPAPLDSPAPPPKLHGAEAVSPGPTRPSRVETEKPPARRTFAAGIKAGQITPWQSIGKVSPAAGLDLRYVYQGHGEGISLGLELGYQWFGLTMKTANPIEFVLDSMPISLQLFYRLPIGTRIEPFIGLGGDLFLNWARLTSGGQKSTAFGIGYGFHGSAGLELALGAGFAVLELRAGFAMLDLDVASGLNTAGIATLFGYRLEI